jgi:hypothetical protein
VAIAGSRRPLLLALGAITFVAAIPLVAVFVALAIAVLVVAAAVFGALALVATVIVAMTPLALPPLAVALGDMVLVAASSLAGIALAAGPHGRARPSTALAPHTGGASLA